MPSYPIARAVAGRVYEHFAANPARDQPDTAPIPDESAMETIIDTAFWASLRQHERYPLKVTIAWLAPEHSRLPMIFGQPLPLDVETVTRLAPAVERPGVHLGVWRDAEGRYFIWGATRKLPPLAFVLEVIAPGFLVVKHRRSQESGKFVNVAVLEGDQIKILDPRSVSMTGAPCFVSTLFGVESPAPLGSSADVLIQIAVSMRGHGRGGALLVVPHGTAAWRESMATPLPYAVKPAYTELADLMKRESAEREQLRWQEGLRRAIEVVAGLTAVDGAMVMTDRCELLGFGAKIGRREGWARVEQVIDSEPVEGVAARVVHPSSLGGTRHLSGAQFGHDQRDAMALVASQDGRFTVFSWSERERAVQAYRVEALLL